MSGFFNLSFGNKTKSKRRLSTHTKKSHGPYPTNRKHHSHSIRFTPHHKRPIFPSKNKQFISYIPPNKLYLENKEVLYSYDLWIDVNSDSKNNESIMNLLNYIYYYYFMKPFLSNNYLHKNVYNIELLFNNTFNNFDSPISTDKFKKVKRYGTFDLITFNKSLSLGIRTFYKLFFFHNIGNVKMELIIDNHGVVMSIPIATDTTILLENGLKYKLKVHHNNGNTNFKLTILDLLI